MSGSRTPEVVSGARAPRGEFKESAKPELGLARIPEGKRIFQANAARYRVQLTAPNAIRFQDGRILDTEKPLVAQFQDFTIMLDMVKDARTIELIEAHTYFKRDFWDLAERIEATRKQRLESAMSYVKGASPEEKEAILAALTESAEESFNLPPRQ